MYKVILSFNCIKRDFHFGAVQYAVVTALHWIGFQWMALRQVNTREYWLLLFVNQISALNEEINGQKKSRTEQFSLICAQELHSSIH